MRMELTTWLQVYSLVALHEVKNCPKCQEPTDRYDGYYRRTADQKLPMLSSETYKHLQTHTGINRFSGTVEHGVLYNRQVFNEGTQFWGLAKIADEHLGSDLKAFLDEIATQGSFALAPDAREEWEK